MKNSVYAYKFVSEEIYVSEEMHVPEEMHVSEEMYVPEKIYISIRINISEDVEFAGRLRDLKQEDIMCGICGYFKSKNVDSRNDSMINAMLKSIAHRGVNGSGYFLDQSAALGFNRLSIIGVANGMQPIMNEDESIALICNGEIYNYKIIKKELIDGGHQFRTDTDIEVILHLYENYGAELMDRINGQFAFVIYDRSREQLFCARDHIGIAPFFYTVLNGTFLFGSEIKSILQYPGVDRKVDLIALDQLMTFPSVISPRTMFEKIQSLESGNYLIIDKNTNICKKKYWDINYPKIKELDYRYSEEQYIEKLNYLLTKAVSERLQSEVPLGFYISGGLDSSIIASKIYETSKEERHSFSVNFSGDNRSERPYQKLMADYVNSIHHEREITISDIADYLPDAVYYSESALKETYNTASLMLSEMANKEGVKVVLTGEGADELFAGYVGYQFDVMRAASTPKNTYEALQEQAVRQQLWGDPDFFYEKDYYKLKAYKKTFYSSRLLSRDGYDCLKHRIIDRDQIADVDLVHKRSYIDLKLRLSEHLLAGHGDRAGLANSVEARYPFLDKKLMEFARIIPPELKLNRLKEKYILKQIAMNIIPEKIIKRPKFAFVAPGSADLLKTNQEYVNDLLSYETIKRQGYFNPDEVDRLRKNYLEPDFKLNLPYDNDLIIIVLTFNILLEKFNLPAL